MHLYILARVRIIHVCTSSFLFVQKRKKDADKTVIGSVVQCCQKNSVMRHNNSNNNNNSTTICEYTGGAERRLRIPASRILPEKRPSIGTIDVLFIYKIHLFRCREKKKTVTRVKPLRAQTLYSLRIIYRHRTLQSFWLFFDRWFFTAKIPLATVKKPFANIGGDRLG